MVDSFPTVIIWNNKAEPGIQDFWLLKAVTGVPVLLLSVFREKQWGLWSFGVTDQHWTSAHESDPFVLGLVAIPAKIQNDTLET